MIADQNQRTIGQGDGLLGQPMPAATKTSVDAA